MIYTLVSVACFLPASAFTSSPFRGSDVLPLRMSTTSSVTEDTESDLVAGGLLRRDRYVATNRFAVRSGQEAKFEKRWATRKSKLATLKGFRYFHLMRRVNLETGEYDGGKTDEEARGNYVSFTMWERKSDFSAWRFGEAFKEAHGGTSIGAFVSTMVNSALILRGPPRPAFYDGLLVQSTQPNNVPELSEGWRNVVADGVHTLPTECFVACNQFFVPTENGAAFEQRWAQRDSKLKECDGFVAFSMLRRDGTQKGHGAGRFESNEPTYQSTTIWRDRKAFENWRIGGGAKSTSGSNSNEESKPSQPPQPLWSKPPKPVFYEATLVMTTSQGA